MALIKDVVGCPLRNFSIVVRKLSSFKGYYLCTYGTLQSDDLETCKGVINPYNVWVTKNVETCEPLIVVPLKSIITDTVAMRQELGTETWSANHHIIDQYISGYIDLSKNCFENLAEAVSLEPVLEHAIKNSDNYHLFANTGDALLWHINNSRSIVKKHDVGMCLRHSELINHMRRLIKSGRPYTENFPVLCMRVKDDDSLMDISKDYLIGRKYAAYRKGAAVWIQDGDCDPREQTLHSPRLFLHDDAQDPRSWDNFFRKVVK